MRVLWWLRFGLRLAWIVFVLPVCLIVVMLIAWLDVLENIRVAVIDEWRGIVR